MGFPAPDAVSFHKLIPVHRNLANVRNLATDKCIWPFEYEWQSVCFHAFKIWKNLTMVVNKSSSLIQMSVASIQPGKLLTHGSRYWIRGDPYCKDIIRSQFIVLMILFVYPYTLVKAFSRFWRLKIAKWAKKHSIDTLEDILNWRTDLWDHFI